MTWKTLRHPNVLPLLGVIMGNRHFAMISEWMVRGNIKEFTKANRDVNRFELVSCPCCWLNLIFITLLVAQRRHQWVDIYAQSINDTRGSERGTSLNVNCHTHS